MATNKRIFVVDAIPFRGDMSSLVEGVGIHVEGIFGDAKVIWIVRTDQEFALGSPNERLQVLVSLPTSVTEVIEECVREAVNTSPGDLVVHVLSHDRAVLSSATKLNSSSTIVVTTNLTVAAGVDKGVAPSSPPPLGIGITEKDRLATEEVLFRGKHFSRETGIKKLALRPLLSAMDPYFTTANHPLGQLFIRKLMAHGESHGWLCQGEPLAGHEPVWLTESAVQEIRKRRAEPFGSDSVPPTPQPKLEEALAPDGRSRDITRMEGSLASARIGSPVDCRNLLFEAFEELISVNSDEGIVSSKLLSEARTKACGSSRSARRDSQAWANISECFFRMLLTSEVLLGGDGKPIPKVIGAYSAPVYSLTDRWRVKAESAMLYHIVQTFQPVPLEQLNSLARTIYHQGKDSEPIEVMRGKLDILLEYLASDVGSIAVTDSGALITIKPPTSELTPPDGFVLEVASAH
ncbi:hypothetical protein [Fimbriimonas ginsengisoli]|uniref:Uncharacterized protein n=1 Tax=Fimbriimonas ginsengisoli Gsoil 348 TaxID=661478 RepID=A0A068NL37_FIMGI|nr:hypothetical protein [Fimbriimonas ginsengisoli]AIE83485.1 hypothetical protein OP10G_0117 [Fimbriimonas ginsengisoli Gsoil 348]